MQDNQDMIDVGTDELQQIDGGTAAGTGICLLGLVALNYMLGTLATLPSQVAVCA